MTPETSASHPRLISSSSLCCYCGEPAGHTLPLDARMQQTRYFIVGRVETLKYGSVFSAPYCQAHYAEAIKIRKRIGTYGAINTAAAGILVASCIILAVVKFDIAIAPGDPVWWSYVMRVFAGILLGGLLLFPFEPFFRALSGIMFPLFLGSTARADLRAHLKAQDEKPPVYTGQLAYLLGMSVKYRFPQGAARFPIGTTIYATDPRFAAAAGVRSVQDRDK